MDRSVFLGVDDLLQAVEMEHRFLLRCAPQVPRDPPLRVPEAAREIVQRLLERARGDVLRQIAVRRVAWYWISILHLIRGERLFPSPVFPGVRGFPGMPGSAP
jgi:hypothetical protein